MNVIDAVFLASISALVLIFGALAVVEWRSRRSGQSAGAQVIQHPASDRKIHHAA